MPYDKPQPQKETLSELRKKRFKNNEEYNDLYNEEVARRIILEGTDEDREKLREFHKISAEKFELILHYEHLRHKTVQQCEKEANKRKQTNPEFTDIEKQIADNKTPNQLDGVYLEVIEPQVRQAVVDLSNKGYVTFESGFYGENIQKIGFTSAQLKEYQPPAELIAKLKEKKVELIIKPDSIVLVCNAKYNLNEIKKIWDQVISDLPERNT